ncbi:MAG: hypothetical protein AB8B53_01750 [Flavobacteriales bacterium]
MNKTIDKLFKILAFPWFAYSAFMIFMLAYDRITNASYDSDSNIALFGFVFVSTAAFRFTCKTWKFKYTKENTELLLDDIDETQFENQEVSFKDYKLSSILAVLAGLISLGTGVWMAFRIRGVNLLNTGDLLMIFLLIVIIAFGCLLVYRAVMVWRAISKE